MAEATTTTPVNRELAAALIVIYVLAKVDLED
jgi:hypothetical protein